MKVSELINELQEFQKEYGDLPVVINADHGQVHMKATYVLHTHTEDLSEYMSEPVALEDVDGHQAVCEVQG